MPKLCWFGLAVVFVLSAPSLSSAQHSFSSGKDARPGVRTGGAPVVQGDGVTVITFEGVANFDPVGTIGLVTFGLGWIGIVDSDAGGTGGFANEPSPDTTATHSLGGLDAFFATPVGSVSFLYSLDTTGGTRVINFRDVNGAVLDTQTLDVCGAIQCGNACVGDPSGNFCAWAQIGFTVSSPPGISSFDITGPGVFGIDDLTYDTNLLPVELQSFTVE